MARLLDDKHDPTEVLEVLEALEKDDKAFYDSKTQVRRIPIFEYDPTDNTPVRITRWQKRLVLPDDGILRRSELLQRCTIEGKDTYIDGVGWVRNGKKRERDYDDPRVGRN